MYRQITSKLTTLLFCVALAFLTGCASLIIKPILDPISTSLQQQNDIALLKDGAPSLLLMIDGFIQANPDNSDLLLDGTRAYTAYASALGEFGERKRAVTVSEKAKTYGISLLDQFQKIYPVQSQSVDELKKGLQGIKEKDIDKLFWGAYGWATWISLQNGSPAAMVDLPRVEQIMLRVIELDDTYYFGAPHIFLGYYYGSIPPMYGGKPEESRLHFEKALSISKRNFLAVQVAYAETYAKMQFDRELYKNLLQEVLDQPVDTIPELISGNQLAKMRAKKLLDTIDEYF
jgi:hypothetical protein